MGKNILICPLNWGLGHATRCVPIVRALREMGHEVVLAADQAPLSFLQKAFPDVELIRFPGFVPRYGSGNSIVLPAMKSAPRLMAASWRDHRAVERIVADYSIDAVISDNRFGAWSRCVPSVFITHQLHLVMPPHWHWVQGFMDLVNQHFIHRYSECWIPDFPQPPFLSGNLSHPHLNMKTRDLGMLSRFQPSNEKSSIQHDIDFLVIMSGPEPQRSIFEKMVLQQASQMSASVVLLRALPDSVSLLDNLPENITAFNHVDDALFADLVCCAQKIICRGGYSSLMDLAVLNRNAFLVPTPGQTEQEFLAQTLTRQGFFNSCSQQNFNLSSVVVPECDWTSTFHYDAAFLKSQLADWIATL